MEQLVIYLSIIRPPIYYLLTLPTYLLTYLHTIYLLAHLPI
jgi:hypothetical protein